MTSIEQVESPSGPALTAAPARGLRHRALHGSAWTFGAYMVGNFLRFGSNLVLAHLLFPEAFALTALVGIFMQALQMFSDVGIGAAIVQSRRGGDPAFLNTAWTIQTLRGVLLWLLTVGLAWPAAKFYGAPELVWIIPVSGLAFITGGLQATALHTRSRDIDLGRITLLGLAETVIKTVLIVVWALIWPSVWAIVGGSLISYVLFMIATHTMLPGIRNRFAWDVAAAKQLMHFGGWVFLSTSVTFLAMQSDRLILGKLVPMEVLGVYSIAYMFSRLPAEIAGRLASQVQFPALAEVFRRDPSRVEAKLLESRRLILAISQFGTLGIVVVSPWFFTLLYDNRYLDAAVFAPMLAGVAWLALLYSSCAYVLLSFGDSKTVALSNGANALVTVPACIIGYHLSGMPGFIAGVGLGSVAGHAVVLFALSLRDIHIIKQDLFYTAVVGIGAAVAMGVPLAFPIISDSALARAALGSTSLLFSAVFAFHVCEPVLQALWRRLRQPRLAHQQAAIDATSAPL